MAGKASGTAFGWWLTCSRAQNLSQGSPEAQHIQDIIDIDLITQQLKSDTLDYMGCANLINSIINVSTRVLYFATQDPFCFRCKSIAK
jgi:hypothetical protein